MKWRTENPEVNSYIYGQLIFDKTSEIIEMIQWWKISLFNKCYHDNWLSTCTGLSDIISKAQATKEKHK